MNSTLKIYDTLLTPQKNYIVDDISKYLESCAVYYTSDNFQFPKIALNISIKVNLSQNYVGENIGFNYVSIDTKNFIYFFFVLSATWKSSETVELNLYLDTLNTYYGHFKSYFSSKTLITRQHVDRWVIGEKTATVLNPKIDKVDEGLTGLPLYKQSDETIESTFPDSLKQPFYLAYQTPETPTASSPIEVFLYPQKSVQLYLSTGGQTITPNFCESGTNYYFMNKDDNFTALFELSPGGERFVLGSKYDDENTVVGVHFYKPTNGNIIAVDKIIRNNKNGQLGYKGIPAGATSFTVSDSSYYRSEKELGAGNVIYSESQIYSLNRQSFESGLNKPVQSQNIENLDRTDSRLIKIIKLPYCPLDLSLDSSGNLVHPQTVSITDDLRLKIDNNAEFLVSGLDIFNLNKPYRLHNSPSQNKDTARLNINDPKIYNSSFYQLKYVYDSFSTNIQLERLEDLDSTATTVFKVSNGMTGNFLFELKINKGYSEIGDYSRFIVSTRNNDYPIFTNAYINYIRTGYNYDRKKQSQSEALTWTTTVLSLVGAGVSAFTGALTGGTGAVLAAGLFSSAVVKIGNAINTTATNEQNVQRQITDAKAQATNVSGVDDLNLLDYYAGNKLHRMIYTVSENMKKKLNDLFYYFGYAVQNYGVPNFDSRLWFNFVQCEPVFTWIEAAYSNYIDDISNRFKMGVTVFHHDANGKYNLEQTKENWEVSLL